MHQVSTATLLTSRMFRADIRLSATTTIVDRLTLVMNQISTATLIPSRVFRPDIRLSATTTIVDRLTLVMDHISTATLIPSRVFRPDISRVWSARTNESRVRVMAWFTTVPFQPNRSLHLLIDTASMARSTMQDPVSGAFDPVLLLAPKRVLRFQEAMASGLAESRSPQRAARSNGLDVEIVGKVFEGRHDGHLLGNLEGRTLAAIPVSCQGSWLQRLASPEQRLSRGKGRWGKGPTRNGWRARQRAKGHRFKHGKTGHSDDQEGNSGIHRGKNRHQTRKTGFIHIRLEGFDIDMQTNAAWMSSNRFQDTWFELELWLPGECLKSTAVACILVVLPCCRAWHQSVLTVTFLLPSCRSFHRPVLALSRYNADPQASSALWMAATGGRVC